MSTRKVVTTLPVSPRHEPVLGVFLIPFLSHLLGKLCNLPVVSSVNLLGTKGHDSSDAHSFRDLLTLLRIVPDTQWLDSDLAWGAILPRVFTDGIAQGWIQRRVVSTFVCPCGKTEFLNQPSNLVSGNFNRKVYVVHEGVVSCLLCKQEAVACDRDTLLLVLPDYAPAVSLVPRYAVDTWRDLGLNLSGCNIPLSRMRETGLSVTIDGAHFNVDVDVTWMLHPYLLRERGMDIEILVCGHKTLKHAFMATVMSDLLGCSIPKTIVSAPYLTMDFGQKEILGARAMVAEYGASVVRVVLLFGLGNTRKEVLLQSRMIHLIQHSIRVEPDILSAMCEIEGVDVRGLWRDFSGQVLQNTLASLRRGHPEDISALEKRVLSIALFG